MSPASRGAAGAGRQRGLGVTYAKYLGLRMVIFLGVLGVTIVIGLEGLVAVLVALLVSGVLSYPLARRQRDEIVAAMRRR